MSSPMDYFYWLFLASAIVSIHYDRPLLEPYTEKQDVFIFLELKGLQHTFSPSTTTISWLQESLHWSACASGRRIRRCTNTAPKHGKKHTLLYLTFVLLSIASDVELNPGPRALKYPCQICSRAVTWNQRGVACDNCDGWYHVQCMGMTTQVYEALNDPNVSWHCVKCGMPQFSSSLFDHTHLETSNTFDTLDQSTDNITGYSGTSSDDEQDTISSSSSSTASFGPPQHTSSPTKCRKKGSKQEQQLRSMKILNVNFQSIRNKKEELAVLIESTEPSIIIGTETWLNSSIFTSEIFPPSYSVVRKDRVGGHGGVLLAVRSDLTYTTLQIQDEGEHVYIKLSFGKDVSLIVGALYRPPNSDMQYMDKICSTIEELSIQNRKAVLWIGGDFNLPDINWEDLSVGGHSNPASINKRFLDMIQNCNLQQMITFPTRGDNVLDLFLTNRPTLINKCSLLPGLGDHDIVGVDSDVTAKRSKPVKRKIYLWKKANLLEMKQDCRQFQQEFMHKYTEQSSVHEMWNCFKISLLNIMDSHVPAKMTSTRFSQPWVTRSVKRSSRRKKRAFNHALVTGRQEDFNRYCEVKKSTQTACKQAYSEYINNIISPDSTANPKRFWSFINSKRNDRTGVAPLKDTNGITHSGSKEKANMLNHQFASVFNRNEDMSTMKDKGPSPFPDMAEIHISPAGVYKLLSSLQVHKATGPDKLPAQLLKTLSLEITPVLTMLFQASLNQGDVPEDWKKADVVPIFKKGERCQAVNYRPVSLTSIICKTLEHIVCSSILEHLDDFHILSDAQHGFRKRRSCTSQLLLTIQDLSSGIDSRDQIDVILLDLSKAFDKVPHGRLLHKIHYYGIRGSTHSWIEEFLTRRSQRVLLDGCFSHTSPVLSGVPQGSVVGPLLFLLFINDLPDCISAKSTVKLFADDCILYRKVSSADDAECLQKDLDALQEWEADWLMQFHPQKCQVMHVSSKRQTSKASFPYFIHGEQLHVTETAKYLGVHIQSNLKWNHHVNITTKKANSVRCFLQRNMGACPQKTKELLCKTLVRPVMEYAAIVWDPSTQENIRKVEMVQRRCARFVLGDYRRTSSVSAMLNQLKWASLQERRAQQKVGMVYSILHGLVDLPVTYFIPVVGPSTRGNPQKFHVPFARTVLFQTTFYPDTIRLWNSLPSAVVDCTSLELFKKKPKEHKANICLWADLDVHKSEEIKGAVNMEEVKRILAEHFALTDYKENPRSAALLDLYFYATQFALNHNFTKEQLSVFFSIVKKTHMVCVETPFGNVEQCYDYFKELVLCHAVLRPPWSVNLFGHEHVRLVIDYVVNTYFRHFKLYKYVFTPLVKLDLSISYAGMPEEDEPQTQEEELKAIEEEADGPTEDDQDQITPEGRESEKPLSPEEEESETTKELRKLITTQLNDELSKLRINLSDQIQQNNDSLQKKLSLADDPGSGKLGRASSKSKKK